MKEETHVVLFPPIPPPLSYENVTDVVEQVDGTVQFTARTGDRFAARMPYLIRVVKRNLVEN